MHHPLLIALLACALPACAVRGRERLPTPAAAHLQNATLDELIQKLQAQQQAIQTLDATVQIEPSVSSRMRGEIVHYRDVRAFVLIRKPALLRMIGQLPVVRSTAFDLASNGETFGLYVPSKNRFIVGDSNNGKRSESALENLRPQHILDALLWQGPQPESEQAALELAPDDTQHYYVVHVLRRGDAHLLLARKLWFERAALTLERLQIFDAGGMLETDARYSDYADFGGIPYPKEIAIDRPQDGYGLILTVEQLRFNQPIADDKFRLERPSGAELVNLDQDRAPAREAAAGG
jgi:outer membrane lipoprotein-sorting protein